MILEADEDNERTDGIWPENAAVLTAFLRVQTQWHYVCPGDGSIRRVGLNYPGVQAGLDLAGIEMTPDLFADLQVIEAGVIAADRKEYDW